MFVFWRCFGALASVARALILVLSSAPLIACDPPKELAVPVLAPPQLASGRITLSWQTVPLAVEYEVHRSLAGADRFLFIGRSAGLAFEDAPVLDDIAFDYRVVAVGSEDERSKPALVVGVTAPSAATAQGRPVEMCNDRDDDGDGQRDESLPDVVTGLAVGSCAPERVACLNGHLRIVETGTALRPEICANGVDDDCDGVIDDPTHCPEDLIPPIVVFSDPADGAVDQPINRSLLVGFDEPVDPASVSTTSLRLERDGQLLGAQVLVSTDRMYAEIRPTAPLADGSAYTIVADGIADLAGNESEPTAVVAFETSAGARDTTRPSRVRAVPTQSSGPVSRFVVPQFYFSEPMRPTVQYGVPMSVERKVGATWETVRGTVRIEALGSGLSFLPDEPFARATEYRSRLGGQNVDLAGNSLATGGGPHEVLFTTDVASETGPPAVTWMVPPDGFVDAPPDVVIAVAFDQAIAPESHATAIIVLADGVPVPGKTVASQVNRTLTFRPDAPLTPGATVVALVNGSTRSISDVAIARPSAATFRIGEPYSTAPTVALAPLLSTVYGPPDLSLVVLFDRPINWLTVLASPLFLKETTLPDQVPVDVEISTDLRSATLRPRRPLESGRVYKLYLPQRTDLAGKTVYSTVDFEIRPTGAFDDIPPHVLHINPAKGTIGVPINVIPRIAFDELIEPSSVGPESVRLTSAAGDVAGSASLVQSSQNIVQFVVNGVLLPATDYTLVAEGITDRTGHPAAPLSVAFRTTPDVLPSNDVSFMSGAVKTASSSRNSADASRAFDRSPFTAWCSASNAEPSPDGTHWLDLSLPLAVEVRELVFDVGDAYWAGREFSTGYVELFDENETLLTTTNELILTSGSRVVLDPPVVPVRRVRFHGSHDPKGVRSCLPGLQVVGRFVDETLEVPDRWAPWIVSVSPADGSIGIPVEMSIVVIFDEPIDPTSITDYNFFVRPLFNQNEARFHGRLTVDGSVVQWTPDSPLPPETRIRLEVGGVTDLAGRAHSARYFTFDTGAAIDDRAPRIIATTPAASSTGVWTETKISLIFDEPLDPQTVTNGRFLIYADGTRIVSNIVKSYNASEVLISATVPPDSYVTVSMSRGVFDFAGNEVVPYRFWYKTAPKNPYVAPAIRSIRPPVNAIGVRTDAPIVFYTDAPLDLASLDRGIAIVADGRSVRGRFVQLEDGTTVTFVPDAPFPPGARVEVNVSSESLTADGQPLLATKTTFEIEKLEIGTRASFDVDPFHSDTVETLPRNPVIEIRFEHELDPAVVDAAEIELREAAGGPPLEIDVDLRADGRTLRIVPIAPLRALVPHYLSIRYLSVLDGSPPLAYSRYFNTSSEIWTESDAPTLAPQSRTFGVPINLEAHAFFEHAVNPLTAPGGGIALLRSDGSTEPIGLWPDADARHVTIIPLEPLHIGETYRLRAEGLQDLAGNVIPTVESTFLIEEGADIEAPWLVESSPRNGDLDVDGSRPLDLHFDGSVIAAPAGTLGRISVDSEAGSVPGSISSMAGGSVLRFLPTHRLAVGTVHRFYASSIYDMAGNRSNPMAVEFKTSLFEDQESPQLVSLLPRDGTMDLPTNTRMSVRFDEPIWASALEYQIRLLSDYGQIPVEFTLSADGRGVSVAPVILLEGNETYQITVRGVRDRAGNRLQGRFTHTFTTEPGVDLQTGSLIARSPAPNLFHVPTNVRLRFEFTRAMSGFDAAGADLIHPSGQTDSVPVDVSLSTDLHVIEFTPVRFLEPNQKYASGLRQKLLLLTGIEFDLASFEFTTGDGPDFVPPNLIASTPTPDEHGLPINPQFVLRFDELLDPTTNEEQVAWLRGPDGAVPVSLSVILDRVHLRPEGVLSTNSAYTLRVEGIWDLAGNAIDPIEVGFTTGAGSPTTLNVANIPGNVSEDMDGLSAAAVVDGDVTSGWCTGQYRDLTSGITPSFTLQVATAATVDAIRIQSNFPTNYFPAHFTSGIVDLMDASGTVIATTGEFPLASGLNSLPLGRAVAGVRGLRFTGTGDGTDLRACLAELELIGSIEDPAFGIADTTAPLLVSSAPARGEQEVALDAAVILRFSEPIDATSVNTDTIKFSVTPGGPGWSVIRPGLFEAQGDTVRFVPERPWEAGRQVSVSVAGLRDRAGNAMTASTGTYFETTSTGPPERFRLVDHSPAADVEEVLPTQHIFLTFSLPVATSTHGIELYANGAPLEFGSWISSGNSVIELYGTWPADSRIDVVISGLMTDPSGRPVEPTTFSYRTGAKYAAAAAIAGVRPAAGAVDVDPDTAITLFADHPIDESSLAAGLHVSVDGTLIAGSASVQGDGLTLVFVPAEAPPTGARVKAFVTPALTSASGIPFAPFESSYTTVTTPDEFAVRLLAMSPSQTTDESQIPLNPTLEVRFDRPVVLDRWYAGPTFIHDGVATIAPGAFELLDDQRVLRFKMEGHFEIGSEVKWTVPAVRGRDDDASRLEQVVWFWPHRNVDDAPPIARITPPDSTTDVPLNLVVRIAFDELVNPVWLDPSQVVLQAASGETIPVSISVTENGSAIRLTPHRSLEATTQYALSVTGVRDLAGNEMQPLSVVYTTGDGPDTTPPKRVSINPVHATKDVPTTAIIVVTMSEPVDLAATALDPGIRLSHGWSVPIEGSVTRRDDGRQWVLAPLAPLPVGTQVNIDVASLFDYAGNELAQARSSFVTSQLPDVEGPQIVGSNPFDGQTDVPRNVVLRVQADERLGALPLGGITLDDSSGPIPIRVDFSADRRSILVYPQRLLDADLLHVLRVDGLVDFAGNPIDEIFESTFTVGHGTDRIAPLPKSSLPSSNSVGVPTDVVPVVSYDDDLDESSLAEVGVTITSSLPGDQPKARAELQSGGRGIRLVPLAPLVPFTSYRWRLGSGVRDVAGNVNNGSYSVFLTTGAGPAVESAAP